MILLEKIVKYKQDLGHAPNEINGQKFVKLLVTCDLAPSREIGN